MEYIGAVIIYAILFFVFKEIANAYSKKKIGKNVFDWSYQGILVIIALLFVVSVFITDKTNFAITVKYVLFFLGFLGIGFYLLIKIDEYKKIGWILLSIVLDMIAFPLVVGAIIALMLAFSRRDCYYWNDCDD
jgi:hypothetical protein